MEMNELGYAVAQAATLEDNEATAPQGLDESLWRVICALESDTIHNRVRDRVESHARAFIRERLRSEGRRCNVLRVMADHSPYVTALLTIEKIRQSSDYIEA